MSGESTVGTLFDLAVSVELIAQGLYAKLAEYFSHVPEISSCFRGMMEDEVKHGEELSRIRDALDPQVLLGEADVTMMKKAREQMRLPIADRLNSVQTLEDAYQLAHELEYSEVNILFEFLATRYVPAKKRHDIIRAEIKKHLEKLMTFCYGYRDSRSREKVLAQRRTRVAA